MAPSEIVAALRVMARHSNDSRLAELSVAAMHRPEWEQARAAVSDPPSATPEAHARALELYPWVIERERAARMHEADAAVLREAADLIEELASAPEGR